MNATTPHEKGPSLPVFAVGHLTVDDVVLSDGETRMGSLGGAALYAALGAQLAGSTAEVISRRGSGVPQDRLAMLDDSGIGSELRVVSEPVIHQWVLYERDGSRRYLLHPDSGSLEEMSPEPGDYSLPAGAWVHIAPMPLDVQRRWCEALAGNAVTLDPHEDMCLERPDAVLGLLPLLDAFLPSEIEARRLTGDDPVAATARFRAAGARIVAIKLGEAGSVVSFDSEVWHVSALPARVVDVTGAGDAYCGAFAASLSRGESGLTAARWGTVAASYVVESRGTGLASGIRPLDLADRFAAVAATPIVVGNSADPLSIGNTQRGTFDR
jgi:ribokinase